MRSGTRTARRRGSGAIPPTASYRRMAETSIASVARSIVLFVVAGLFEIGGGYLVWRWWREGAPWPAGALGALILIPYGGRSDVSARAVWVRVCRVRRDTRHHVPALGARRGRLGARPLRHRGCRSVPRRRHDVRAAVGRQVWVPALTSAPRRGADVPRASRVLAAALPPAARRRCILNDDRVAVERIDERAVRSRSLGTPRDRFV